MCGGCCELDQMSDADAKRGNMQAQVSGGLDPLLPFVAYYLSTSTAITTTATAATANETETETEIEDNVTTIISKDKVQKHDKNVDTVSNQDLQAAAASSAAISTTRKKRKQNNR